MVCHGWSWRGNVAQYDFKIGNDRFRGTLAIKKNSGLLNGKTPAERADEAVREIRVQQEQKFSVETIWEQTKKKMISPKKILMNFDSIWENFEKKGMCAAGIRRKKIYCGHLREFCDWINQHYKDISDVSEVTDIHAREYLGYLRGLPGASATKNDKLATLKMIFNALGRSAGVIENPFLSKDIRRLPTRQVKREIYTPAQIQLLFSATGWMYELFVTAFSTFQREEDCCLLKKSYVHLEQNRITFPFTHKTGVEISLPLMPRFRELAERALRENPCSEYLFPTLAMKYQKDPSSIGKEVKIFLAEHGIENTTIEVDGYAKRVSVLDVHSIRHTSAVLAVLMGWPLPMVMKATGHKSLKMVMRYLDHISDDEKERYFQQFQRAFPGKKAPRELTRRRLIRLIQKINLDNFAKSKKRLLNVLEKSDLK